MYEYNPCPTVSITYCHRILYWPMIYLIDLTIVVVQHHELSPGVIAEDVVRKLGIAGEDCKYDDGKIGGRLPEEEWRAIEMVR